MGQIAVASDSGTLRTLVGSCVSVALFDPRLHLAGLAHVLLPESHGTTEEPGRFADTAITELLRQLNKLSRGKQPHWRANIAGGAAMFPGHEEVTVGTQNITAVETLLRKNRIPIVAKVLWRRARPQGINRCGNWLYERYVHKRHKTSQLKRNQEPTLVVHKIFLVSLGDFIVLEPRQTSI